MKKFLLFNEVTSKVLVAGRARNSDLFWNRHVANTAQLARAEKKMQQVSVYSEDDVRKMTLALRSLK
jgi:predicted alpha/beta hydrolase family esterase